MSGQLVARDVESERVVLGGLFTHARPEDVLRHLELPVEAFWEEFHRDVWVAVLDLYHDGDQVTLPAVRYRLTDRHAEKYADPAKTASLLADLLDGMPRSTWVQAAAERLKELAYRRDLAQAASEAAMAVTAGDKEPGEIEIERAREARRLRDKWARVTGKGTGRAVIERLHEFYRDNEERAVRTGFPDIDATLGEVHPGTVLTVLARPAVGKSNLGLNLVANWLDNQDDWGILFCSIEMPETLTSSRLVRIMENWTRDQCAEQMRAGKFPKAFMKRSAGRLVINDNSRVGMVQLEKMFREAELTIQRRVRAVLIDYLQLMHGERHEKKYERISRLTAELKEFAKRKDVLLVLLSQVSRGEAGGEGWKPPSAQSARDSGTIEENSDFMLGMWRPELNEKCVDELRGKIALRVLKGRNGGQGETFVLHFDEDNLQMWESGAPASTLKI